MSKMEGCPASGPVSASHSLLATHARSTTQELCDLSSCCCGLRVRGRVAARGLVPQHGHRVSDLPNRQQTLCVVAQRGRERRENLRRFPHTWYITTRSTLTHARTHTQIQWIELKKIQFFALLRCLASEAQDKIKGTSLARSISGRNDETAGALRHCCPFPSNLRPLS